MFQISQYELFPEIDEINHDTKIITKSQAVEILNERFGFEPQLVFDAIKSADNNFDYKSNLNPASGISRWGDINESIAQQLLLLGYKHERLNGQPTLINEKYKIQLVVMSANKSIGNIDAPISSNCPKGSETETKIKLNQPDCEIETWFLYYPSRGHAIYQSDSPELIFEVAKPTSVYVVNEDKIFPINHESRLIFTQDGEPTSYISEFADESLNEDSFDIGYKVTGSDE